jgi:hypothetical protein
MAFNDGEPIDAAKLGALETSLAEIKAKVPQFGSSTTNISIDNTSLATTVIPQIFGGISGTVTLTPGKTTGFTINYSAAKLTSAPKSIMLTPVRETGTSNHAEAYVVKSSISATTAQCKVFQPVGTGYSAGTTSFYFLVIQHS